MQPAAQGCSGLTPCARCSRCTTFTTSPNLERQLQRTVRDHAGTARNSSQESAQIGIASTRQVTLLNPVESSLHGCLHG